MLENNPKKSVGKRGEEIAVGFLKNLGYAIMETNFRNPSGRQLGEIDIIARDPENREIVFAEVKTRRYNPRRESLPEENITYWKLKKLARVASFYLKKKRLEEENYRFDALSVWLDPNGGKSEVKHLTHIYL